jgi:hypothetical protein
MDYTKKGKGTVGAVKHCRSITPELTRKLGTGSGADQAQMKASGKGSVSVVRNTVKRGPDSKTGKDC